MSREKQASNADDVSIQNKMKILFVRHGETDTNIKEKQGEAIIEDDAPLNENGKKQANDVARQLKNERIDAIFTSPYKRATETAEIIAQFHHVPIIKLNELRERSCGTLVGDRFHELFDFDKDIRGDGIEPVGDFFQRVYNTIEKIRASGYNNIIVVSHGGVSHAFRAYFNNLEWKGNLRVDRLKNCDFRVYWAEKTS